jgi:hypothetical protein
MPAAGGNANAIANRLKQNQGAGPPTGTVAQYIANSPFMGGMPQGNPQQHNAQQLPPPPPPSQQAVANFGPQVNAIPQAIDVAAPVQQLTPSAWYNYRFGPGW